MSEQAILPARGSNIIRDYSELRASMVEGEMERFFVTRRAFGGELHNQGVRTCGEAQDVRIKLQKSVCSKILV